MEEYKRKKTRINRISINKTLSQEINMTNKPSKSNFRSIPIKGLEEKNKEKAEQLSLLNIPEEVKEIVVEEIEAGGILQIEIVDSGCGISEKRVLELNTRVPFNSGLKYIYIYIYIFM